jgi:hypothetical protein
MIPAVPAFVAMTAVAVWAESQRPPKRPDRPFRLFVFAAEPKGEQDAVDRIRRAEEECEKIAKRRKDWFVVVESREQAEIVMEIQAYWVYEDFRTESSPLSGTPVNVSRENHHLFAQVNVLGGVSELRVDDGRRLTGAASKLMDSLEELCKKDYWQILGRRDPSGIAR